MAVNFNIQSGQLRHKIEVQNEVETRDEIGASNTTYQTASKTFAEVREMSGKELEFARQQTPQATHKIKMRYMAGLTEQSRIIFGDNIFDVENVNNIEFRNKVMILTVTEDKTARGDGTAL